MPERLNQEKIRRMTGSGGAVGGGGGLFDPSALAGYASQAWVEDNYISKLFFGRMFTANGTQKVYTSTDGGATWGDPVTTSVTIAPNEITPSEEIVDGETSGTKIKTVRELSSIQALVGLWTQQYLSALGQNSSGGGGGGGSSTLAGLLDVNIPNPMTQVNDGQVLMYNYTQNKWINGNLPATGVTSVGVTVPTGFSVSPAMITSTGTFAITFASGYSLPTTAKQSNWDTAYGWGDHTQAGYALAANVYSKTEADQKFMTIAAFENLFAPLNSSGNAVSHPYSSGVDSIKALFGLWTQQYVSALGQNSSGGGGGASTLAGLNDVQLGTLSDGQVLKYDGNLNKWVNGNLPATGVTSVGMTVPTGLSVSPATITSSGTFVITFASGYSLPTTAKQANWDAAYTDKHTHSNKSVLDGITSTDVSHWDAAYGWGDHAQAGYALAANVYSKTEADAKFMTIAAFENLFAALNSSGNAVSHPYSSGVDSIKVLFGLWTQQYLSALGQNSSGGGGGASTLAGLNDVQLGTLSDGQVLKYDGNLNKWVNGNLPATGVTSVGMTVPTGFSVDPAAITSSGTFAITYASGYSLPLTADVSKGVTAYGWGDHAQAGYSTPSSVASQMQTYAKIQSGTITIGDNSITPLTQHQTVGGTFWGQSWSNGGTVSGDMTGVGTIKMTGHLYMHEGGTGIYLNSDGTGIDWHDASDAYVASLLAFTSSMVTAQQGLTIPVNKSLRIGDGVLTWDAANNAFKVEKYDGTAANFYATGGVSALGVSTGGSVTNLTVSNNLTLGGELTFGTNDASIYMDDYFYIESGSTVSINGVECYSGNVWLNRLYLDTTRYLYVSEGNLYYYNGSESKQIAFIN